MPRIQRNNEGNCHTVPTRHHRDVDRLKHKNSRPLYERMPKNSTCLPIQCDRDAFPTSTPCCAEAVFSNRYVCPTTSSVDGEKLYIEDQSGSSRNARLSRLAIGLRCGDVHLPAVADMHLLQGNDPSGYKLTQSESRRRSSTTAVESATVDGLSDIMHRHHAPSAGQSTLAVARPEHLIEKFPCRAASRPARATWLQATRDFCSHIPVLPSAIFHR